MSEQDRVPRLPIGRWIGFAFILMAGPILLLGLAGEPNNWPSTAPGWAVIALILAIVYAGLVQIGITLFTSALAVHEARRLGLAKPAAMRQLRGWLLVYAAVCFPLIPLYIVVTKQKSGPDSVIGWLVFAFFFVAAWIALQITHVILHDPNAIGRALRKRSVQRTGVMSTIFVVLLGGYVISTPAVFAQEGKVVRVVDGDTVDVRVDAGVRRIRVLNIDTPESVDPNKPVECLSEEATELTRSLLAKGQTINLEYDVERTDRYGRTLAHIELGGGRMLSTELAKAGLGVPMVVGRNDARIGEIQDAFDSATDAKRGFFDPKEECTFAARTTKVSQATTEALAVDQGVSAAEALAAAATVAVVAKTYARLRNEIAAKSSLPVRAFLASSQSAVVARVASSLKSIDDRETKLRGVAAKRDVAEKKARIKFAEQAAIAAKRKKAEEVQRKAAAKLAAQEAARQRAANATKPRAPAPKPRITKPRAPAPNKSSGGKSGGSYPGYTGPRCYAPGGKTWRPC